MRLGEPGNEAGRVWEEGVAGGTTLMFFFFSGLIARTTLTPGRM